jgi:hypothetical protein
MEKVIRDDYVFDIDIEKAKGFYSDAPKVFDGLTEYLPELTCFMASLGIDIEKPVKYDPNDAYDFLYTTFGTVTSKNGYELDFYGEDKYVSVAVISACESVITIEVFGIKLKKE